MQIGCGVGLRLLARTVCDPSNPTYPREQIERREARDEFGHFPSRLRGFDFLADFDVFFALIGFLRFFESVDFLFGVLVFILVVVLVFVIFAVVVGLGFRRRFGRTRAYFCS